MDDGSGIEIVPILRNSNPFEGKSIFQVVQNELRLRNYSPRTIKAYNGVLRGFVRYFYPKHPRELTAGDVKRYLLYLIDERGVGRAAVDQAINALKFLYVDLYSWDSFLLEVPRPKKERRLPVVLSREEVLAICHSTGNPRHRLMLELMYGSGLRVSEVVQIRVQDVDLVRLTLFVRGGKGKKDRLTVISRNLVEPLRRQAWGKSASDLLFPSSRGGKLTVRSLQKVFSAALEKSGICKNASCHSLRHSFATHLLESGVDIRYIQSLLGHARIETTNLYAKVRNPHLLQIASPL